MLFVQKAKLILSNAQVENFPGVNSHLGVIYGLTNQKKENHDHV